MLKFNLVAKSTRTYTVMAAGGLFIAFILFTAHRYFSPIDLTLSTMVTAPHSVLSPALGQQVDTIAVTHNQRVKKGDPLYRLVDDKLRADELTAAEQLRANQIDREQKARDLERKRQIATAIPVSELELAHDLLDVAEAQVSASEARLRAIQFELGRLDVTAPFDGQVSHVYVGEGSRVGALHLWDTGQKFVVMRIPDQAYGFVKPGQFAEFFVDAYPGHIFRARVHSVTGATGEAAGNLLPSETMVGQQVQRGALSVGRTVILEFEDPEGIRIPIGATGSAWISATKPALFAFIDVIGAATLRLYAAKAYLGAL